MKATAKDLRFHAKEILETVLRGEEVVITYRGKPCAKVVPIDSSSKIKINNKVFGMWEDNNAIKDVDKYIREKRKGRFAC